MAPTKTLGSLSLAIALFAIGFALYSKESPVVTFADLNQPKLLTEETSVPSRSSSFPTNLVREGAMNEIGQRPIDNSVKVWFTLHENGNGLSEGIKLESSSFTEIDDVISTYCCDLMKMEQERCKPNSGARLISDTGVRMLSFNDIEDGQRVYCVPQGVHFVWPMKKTGHSFYPKNVVGPIPGKPIRMRQLTENPRVFSVDNFVTPEEVEEILRSNRNRMTPSEVGFGGWQDETRTSSTSWDFTSKAARTIQARTFQILGMDVEPDLADALQVLRYNPPDPDNVFGQWYKPHVDWFNSDGFDGHDPKVNNGTNRFATMFLYLSDVAHGGATVFPLSTTHEGYNGERLVHDGTVDVPGYINTKEARYCCNESSTALRSQPKQGNAVLFYSQGPDGALDAYSLHGGCPPLTHEKWSANVWVWNRKRPDKSVAKDMPKDKKKDTGSLLVTFRNAKGNGKVDVYWDSNAPVTGFHDLEAFTNDFKSDSAEGFHRFKLQGTIMPSSQFMVNTYNTHVFVMVNQATGRVMYVHQVQEDANAIKDEDGQIIHLPTA